MIIRKPYAFLIKNFKKIHIILLLLSLYIAYKTFDVSGFVNEFMEFGIYDYFNNPITRHISMWLQIATVIMIVGSTAILFLLRYKEKPWKLYLVPVIEYTALFFVLNMIKGFFNVYNTTVKTTDVRLSRDLLIMLIIAQLPAVVILVMRVFGLDKKRFNFNQDEEFLNLNEKDREEVEINIDIDKNSFKRFYKRTRRNIMYFYREHKGICIGIIVILVVSILFNSYKYIFVTNKSYNEGDIYSANGYTMRVNNAYYTDKDYHGKVITKKSDFVVVEIDIVNNSETRTIKTDNFHLKNGTKDYVSTRTTYANEFIDFGKTYDSVRELRQNEKTSFIIVFKVDKDLNKNRFVLFYQEEDGYLRKIKLNLNDVSKVEKQKDLKIGDKLKINIVNNPDTISIDNAVLVDSDEYVVRKCDSTSCYSKSKTIESTDSYKIMKLEFGTEIYNSKDLISFLEKYGTIIYIDSNKDKRELEVENVINERYKGKEVFIKLPPEIDYDTTIDLNLVIRNKEYVYHLT